MRGLNGSDDSSGQEFGGMTPNRRRYAVGCSTSPEVRIPYICILEWRLLETYRGTMHLVGRVGPSGKLWATPPILEVELSVPMAVATDGREYVLLGEPGTAAIAAYFVSISAAFDERLMETTDVTSTLASMLREVRATYGTKRSLHAIGQQKVTKIDLDFLRARRKFDGT
ncbi:hypothetical protein [Cupriavidus sp. USMAA2-4]|uniref:hypothetical protein n=1 Tax=Cupriavidus sp. USMAA2-4 TaxID=876364 RepID=UPI0012F52980|nr:hypothetical protein [Cupriavidus sp. USMAA2-4]